MHIRNGQFYDFPRTGSHNYLTVRATKSVVSIMVWKRICNVCLLASWSSS